MRDSWVETTLGGIADVIMGQSPDGNSYNQEGKGLPFMQGSAEFGEHNPVPEKWCSDPKKIAEPGDLLLSVRAPVGDTNFADQRIAVGRGLSIIRANKESLTKFIRLVIQLNVAELIASSGSGMFASITGKNLKEFKVNLPPLPEQKRIVDLISSVDTYIEALQQQLGSAKRSRNAVLHELLTAGGDDWVEHKLIDMFEIYQPQTIAKSLMSNDGEFIVFGANGPIGRYHEFNHEEPEVVVTCRGATCGTINMTPPKTWITGNAMVVSPKTSEVSKVFLYWALVAGVDIQSVISGSAQPQITREGLAPVKINIPPLSRQEEIVDLISGFELNISHLEESLNKTKTLRSGLLSDLLSGEHQIPASYDKVIGAA